MRSRLTFFSRDDQNWTECLVQDLHRDVVTIEKRPRLRPVPANDEQIVTCRFFQNCRCRIRMGPDDHLIPDLERVEGG